MKKSLLTTAALTLALVAGLAFQPPPATATPCEDGPRWERSPRPDGFEGRRAARMAEALGLSAEQQERIRALTEDHRTRVAPLRQTLEENRSQLRQAARAETFDDAAVRAAAEHRATARIELAVERARLQHQIHSVLTPEQREKAEKLRAEKGYGRGHHHGGHRR